MAFVKTGLPGIDEALVIGRFLRIRKLLDRNRRLQLRRYAAHRDRRRQALEEAVLEMLPGREKNTDG